MACRARRRRRRRPPHRYTSLLFFLTPKAAIPQSGDEALITTFITELQAYGHLHGVGRPRPVRTPGRRCTKGRPLYLFLLLGSADSRRKHENDWASHKPADLARPYFLSLYQTRLTHDEIFAQSAPCLYTYQ